MFLRNLGGGGKHRGFGLIEVIIAIAISAAAAYYFLVMVPQAKESNLVQKEIQNMTSIQSAVIGIYRGSPPSSYGTLSNSVLIAANAIPSSMINGSNIINSWGGPIVVNGVSLNGFGNGTNGFTVSTFGVPEGACVKLTMALGQSAVAILINSNSWIKSWSDTGQSNTAIDPSSVAAACASGGNNNAIYFDWW